MAHKTNKVSSNVQEPTREESKDKPRRKRKKRRKHAFNIKIGKMEWRPTVDGRLNLPLGVSQLQQDKDLPCMAACIRFEIRLQVIDHRRIIHGGDFQNLLHRALAYFFGHILFQKAGGLSEVHIVDIYLLDKLYNHLPLSLSSLIIQTTRNTGCDTTKKRVFCYPMILSRIFVGCHVNFAGERIISTGPHFRSIKKTTQTGLGASFSQPAEDDDEADESYNPLDDEEDETGAQNRVLMDAFQTDMRIAFEQLRITQEIHGMQLTEMIESTRCYADELAHQRASIDCQGVMLARLCQRFMPDQGSRHKNETKMTKTEPSAKIQYLPRKVG
ncbi:hypothetical protein M9H77_18766 [Catharanthus roseus]|uniref:Uncharacterized protein n=1 Tax=Catharanthus roseus TaxID=4058 RepID=A0ACC0B8F4_CATRO|nr:hypothetical protein M9H77_18766 [Catharanthus roseus]